MPTEGLETIRQSGDIYVPFSVDDYRFLSQPQGDTLWCHAWRSGEATGSELFTGDLNLYDNTGNLILEVKGLRIKRAPQKALFRKSFSPTHRLDVMDWKPFTPSQRDTGQWLLAGSEKDPLLEELATILKDKGGSSQILTPKTPISKEQWIQHLEEHIGPWSDVVYFCHQDLIKFEEMDWDDAQRLAADACWGPLALVQALIQKPQKNGPRVWLVTRGAQDTGRMDLTAPHQSSLWGLGRVLSTEHPNLWGGMIDLDPHKDTNASQLFAAISGDHEEDHLCLRADHILCARLKPAEPSQKAMTILGEGTYLVTGGLGGLGLKVTEMLAKRGAGRIVLTGRHGPDEDTRAILRKLEKKGADIMVEKVDVSDVQKMTGLFKSLTRFGPPLKGIIHTAGVIDDGLLTGQTLERFNKVMAPKINGAWNLHQLSRNENLDFFILFSAAAGILGNPGQANYAAANNFMDALAHYRRNKGLPGVSIAWGAWAEAGMAARMTQQNRKRLADQGMGEMEVKWGLAAMDQMANGESAQILALSIDWNLYAKRPGLVSLPVLHCSATLWAPNPNRVLLKLTPSPTWKTV